MSQTRNPQLTYGATAFRLGWREWLVVLGIVGLTSWLVPVVWPNIEKFKPDSEYRVPYELSRDYWLYEQRLKQGVADLNAIPVVGDSVIWGEYVNREATLSHYLNQLEFSGDARFFNGGLNGLFPLALEGLIRYYASPLQQRSVILHCNLLWLSSAEVDLSSPKEQRFNHPRLVPQIIHRLPSYRAKAAQRLGIVIERRMVFLQWAQHLRSAYFSHQSFPEWTLLADDQDPRYFPNTYRNPCRQFHSRLGVAELPDPQRGEDSARHRPWYGEQPREGTRSFEWVPLEQSLQWQAFTRLVELLRARDNSIFVLIGPFNQHVMAPEKRPIFLSIRKQVAEWLIQEDIPHARPDPLPSRLYGDASHPLTEGYARLASGLQNDQGFQNWLSESLR